MIHPIRTTLEVIIVTEREKKVQWTAGYSNDEKALRWKCGMKLAAYEAGWASGVGEEESGIVDVGLLREPKGMPDYVKGIEPEDGVKRFITSM